MFRRLPRNFGIRLLLGVLILGALSAHADDSVTVSRAEPKNRIRDLILVTDSAPAKIEIKEDRFTAEVTLKFRFSRNHWHLLSGNREVFTDAKGDFELTVPLTEEVTELPFSSVGPFGEVEEEAMVITYPGLMLLRERSRAEALTANAGISLLPALGLTQVSYTQTGKPDYDAFALIAKFDALYPVNASWDWMASGSLTALPLSGNSQGVSVRFLSVDLRGAYAPAILNSQPNRIKFKIVAGAYFTTMLVSPDVFGYHNISGPEFFPAVEHSFQGGAKAGAYFKLSPIAKNFSLMTLSNREIATGIHWRPKTENGRTLSFSLDLAQLSVQAGAPFQTRSKSTTLTASVALGL